MITVPQLQEQLQKYYEQFVLGEIDNDTFQSLKKECTGELEKTNRRLTILKQSQHDEQASKKITALAEDALNDYASPQDIVGALVDRVLVFPDNQVEIEWKFASFAT